MGLPRASHAITGNCRSRHSSLHRRWTRCRQTPCHNCSGICSMPVPDACTTSDGAAGVARPDAAASATPAATGGNRVVTGTTPSQWRAFLRQYGQRGWRTGGEREEWFLEGGPHVGTVRGRGWHVLVVARERWDVPPLPNASDTDDAHFTCSLCQGQFQDHNSGKWYYMDPRTRTTKIAWDSWHHHTNVVSTPLRPPAAEGDLHCRTAGRTASLPWQLCSRSRSIEAMPQPLERFAHELDLAL